MSREEKEDGEAAPTLLERLDHWAKTQPDKVALTFLDDFGAESDRLTYKEVKARAQAVAAGLTSGGYSLKPGDRVLLVYLPSLDFIIAFLGSIMAQLVPVPVFPPDPRRLKKDLYMFASIQSSSGAQIALTHAAYNYVKKVGDIQNMFKAEKAAWPDTLTWIPTDKLSSGKPSSGSSSSFPPPSSPCFLQYTSGSTSAPKGVVITHRNLTHNLDIITKELRTDASTIEVSWLPQYHDMGLIGSYLGLLYCGGTGFYMSPFSFIRNPVLWVTVISKVRGTHMQAPNFAFALTAKKYLAADKKPPLDLTCVRHMINAAEPVDGPSLDAFTSAFRPHGLPDGVIYPTYGLAEHTVFVCSGGRQRLVVDRDALEGEQKAVLVEARDAKGREIVGCGQARHGVHIVIANPDTNERLAEGRVGEIWVNSPSKAAGYFNLEPETKEVFHAELKEEAAEEKEGGKEDEAKAGGDEDNADSKTGEEKEAQQQQEEPPAPSRGKEEEKGGEEKRRRPQFLRTGDLGFIYQGELFVCGRIKDLIILRGRNHYPQDIEKNAEKTATELRPGCSAAFPVPALGEEAIALVAEVRELSDGATYQQIVDRVFKTLSQDDGVVVSHIWLLKPRTVPKTTSGKIARKWCQKAFRERTLQTVYEWSAPSTAMDEAGGSNGEAREAGATEPPPTLDPLVEGQFAAMTLDDIVNRLVVLAGRSVTGGEGAGPERIVVPLMALGLDSMALAQLKGAVEHYFGVTVPDEIYFQENISIKRLGVILYAIGHGRDPREALSQYEANATAFEIEAGANFQAVRSGGRFDWVIQTSPCCLCFPCCR